MNFGGSRRHGRKKSRKFINVKTIESRDSRSKGTTTTHASKHSYKYCENKIIFLFFLVRVSVPSPITSTPIHCVINFILPGVDYVSLISLSL